MLQDETRSQIELVVGTTPRSVERLSGGMIGDVYRLRIPSGDLVAKVDQSANPQLNIEGMMLRYLATNSALPVPQLLFDAPNLLLMAHVEGRSQFDAHAETHAAELLAALHGVSAEKYGFNQDTLVGKFNQPNPEHDSWLEFFRQQRLLAMADLAHSKRLINKALLKRITALATRLDKWLTEPSQPSLVHGDVWTTNVLAADGQIAAFLDPAIYYADAEIELAYILWTGTFGNIFFERYSQIRPISDNFFTERQYVYQLYPLLVHVLHFGRSYVDPLEAMLAQLGF